METIFDTLLSNITEPTFVAAVAGAVVGGLIAYFIQRKVLSENRRQRAEDIRRTQEMLGISLIIKMMRVHSDIHHIHQHVEESMRNAGGPERELWQVVQPLANPLDPVSFSSEELSMLMSMRDDRIFNMVLPLDRIHSAILSTVKIHYSERTVLLNLIGEDDLLMQNVEYTGNRGRIQLNEEQLMRMKRLEPRMIAVNCLVDQLHNSTKRYINESKEALLELHNLLQDNMDLHYKLEFDYCENA